MSWALTLEKIGSRLRELQAATVREALPLSGFRFHLGDGRWKKLDGWTWPTAAEQTAWLRIKVDVPAQWRGNRVCLHVVPNGCEILAHVNGDPRQAFDEQHHDLMLSQGDDAASYRIDMEAYSGLNGGNALEQAELRCIDAATADLYYDLAFAYQTARAIDAESREYGTLLAAMDAAVGLLDFRQGTSAESFYHSVRRAREQLWATLGGRMQRPLAPVVWAVGHAHLDTAWLWRIAHTRRKAARTFATALELMRRYPDYHFTCSQPQQYQYVKEDHPQIYQSIRRAVKEGRWEPVGGMWVESDCNLISGESMARQFLHGQRFFEREFGKKSEVVWLPDVFGYSAAFPQLIRQAGMRFFMTIKIFWNQFNRPPYQTFKWVGLDGSDVLVHFSPLGDYNAKPVPDQLRRCWNDYRQKNLSHSALMVYGWGDGGGGPTADMLEFARRAADFVAAPKVKLASSAAFFEDLAAQVEGHPHLPVWNGELYLEYHRGTYTSQARNKKANRQSEFLLQTAEQVAALAWVLHRQQYPRERLRLAWEKVLTNQFHDILPGSSIREVYQDSAADYREVRTVGEAVIGDAMQTLGRRPGDGVLLYNPLSWARRDVAALPAEWGVSGQQTVDWDGRRLTLVELNGAVPSLGYAVMRPLAPPAADLHVSRDALENDFFRLRLDANGEIESLWDKRARREVMAGAGNALVTFEDKPLNWDAWDIDVFYQDKPYPLQHVAKRRIIERGPVRGGVEITRHLQGGRGSVVRQRIFVYAGLPRIDFDTEIDWREKQTLLKVAFPVAIHALRATYDIQFGNVERPTHWNTSWDWARFEVCGHKWADLSEGDYGVSLLSDCKYGWDIRGNVMRLTLLKSAVSPDPNADEGVHRFVYSLYPHVGDWRAAETVRRAYELNVPVQAVPCASKPRHLSMLEVDAPNLVVETVKMAEDEDALIVRLHETCNQRGQAALRCCRPLLEAAAVNLLEDAPFGEQPVCDGNTVRFSYRPYEVKTFRLRVAH